MSSSKQTFKSDKYRVSINYSTFFRNSNFLMLKNFFACISVQIFFYLKNCSRNNRETTKQHFKGTVYIRDHGFQYSRRGGDLIPIRVFGLGEHDFEKNFFWTTMQGFCPEKWLDSKKIQRSARMWNQWCSGSVLVFGVA